MTKLPSLFISHGSPMLALENEPTTQFLRQLSAQFPKPKAIIVISAHWETDAPTVTGAAQLDTIYDFSGFPKELYALRYPAVGEPKLAQRVQSLLQAHDIETHIDTVRGLDHGAWNPLLLMYPEADIPVIGLSIQPKHDARWHYKIGQALAPLRDEGILILATGNLTHNLREAFRGQHTDIPSWVVAFANWVAVQLQNKAIENLLNWQTLAPYARQNHPTPDHFLPFFVALGAGDVPLQAKQLHNEVTMGVLAMDAYAF